MKRTSGNAEGEPGFSISRAGATEAYCSISELCRINERRDLGCLLLNASSRVVFVSALGQRFLKSGGMSFDHDAVLRAEDPDQQSALYDLVASTGISDPLAPKQVALRRRRAPTPLVVRSTWVYFTNGGPDQLVALPRKPPRRVDVSDVSSRFPVDVRSHEEGCLLWLRDPSFFGQSAAKELAHTFGLTPRESELVLHLARGEHVSQFAALHGVSMNTVKSHLKQAFLKCGVNSQAQLVACALGFLR